jgi:hypothetical protein
MRSPIRVGDKLEHVGKRDSNAGFASLPSSKRPFDDET